MPSPVFSATTYAPLHERIDTPPQQSRDVLLKVSREKYTKKRDYVEKKIFEYAAKISDDEKKYRKEKEEYKEGLKIKKETERKQNSLGESVESQTPNVAKMKTDKEVERKKQNAEKIPT